MVSIEVVTEPLGAEVTWDGEIKGISPIIIEVELPKTIDDFRDECIGKCGKVGKYLYLPICEWDVLRGWLESGLISEHWWELTDDERWCIAYKTASMESTDEISKYNLPLYNVMISTETTPINTIQIKTGTTTTDDWLFFTHGEPNIIPGKSTQIPDGSIISIFDGVGNKIAEIDLSYLWLHILRDECLRGGKVVCSWSVLEEWLISNKVGRLWWDLTDTERYNIVDMAVRQKPANWEHWMIKWWRNGKMYCGGGDGEWVEADCTENANVRYLRFSVCPIETSGRYYTLEWSPSNAGELCMYTEHTYHLPAGVALVIRPSLEDHNVACVQIKEDFTNPDSWYFFQYASFDIKVGDPQIDISGLPVAYLRIDTLDYANVPEPQKKIGYYLKNIIFWYYENGEIVRYVTL